MASIKFLDKPRFYSKFNTKKYPVTKIIYRQPFGVKIEEQLPFRIRFSSIGIPSYGPTDIPPIGIAVIGYNNYIL